MKPESNKVWWKDGVIYQIYPRSFKDSNNDGIGDIKGIISELDYLNDGTKNSLGVDAIWLSPIYQSPMKDFGYDISDYRNIDKVFGNMEDFKLLLNEAHRRNIKIIMDLVINHTSDKHPWFIDSRSSIDNPKRNWYIWRKKKVFYPNNWISFFELHSAWWLDKNTNEYYLASFTRYQPEVNLRNTELKEEMFEVIKYWFELGVDGFRLDVVNWYIKDDRFRNNPWKLSFFPLDIQKHLYDRNRPEAHEICKEIRKLTDKYDNRMLIGEISRSTTKEAISYQGNGKDELHMAFNFIFLNQRWNAKGFYNKIKLYYSLLSRNAWPNFTLSNHDQPRHYSRYSHSNNLFKDSDARAKVAAAMLLTLKGTPFLYYGEEIGMSCGKIKMKDLQDSVGKKYWPFYKGRDGERTPMQWNDSEYAGFSKAKPWLPVNHDFIYKNVSLQKNDKTSLLSFYRELIWLRKENSTLSHGDIEFFKVLPSGVLGYKRSYNHQEVVIFMNFSGRRKRLSINSGNKYSIILGTHKNKGEQVSLDNLAFFPYEIIIAV